MPFSEHFFRHESGRLIAALTRVFGTHDLTLAEDVTQHAFCRALEVWKVRGIPENPSAWLLATAKNRALDVLRRERTARAFAPELSRIFDREAELTSIVDAAFEPSAIQDEQLRMMLSCCHPQLGEETRLALILNILCGFGPAEIASSLLMGRAAIEKRITRGKHFLAGKSTLFELNDAELEPRLGTLRHALYLLFNEGYHGASRTGSVRTELCHEALRLVGLLLTLPSDSASVTRALAALMALNAARLPARIDAAGELLAWAEQDRTRWDQRLLADGLNLFERSTSGDLLSAYHVEAAIAVAHVSAPSVAATDWRSIVELYDRLYAIAPSPVVALGRAIALGERDGPAIALEALRDIAGVERLSTYPFYPAALGEFERRRGNFSAARAHLRAAVGLCRNETERRFLEKKLAACSD